MASVSESRARLSGYLECAKAGEEVLGTDRGGPIARLGPIRPMHDDRHLRRLAEAAWSRLQGNRLRRTRCRPPTRKTVRGAYWRPS